MRPSLEDDAEFWRSKAEFWERRAEAAEAKLAEAEGRAEDHHTEIECPEKALRQPVEALIARWDTAGLGSGDERLIENLRAALAAKSPP